MGCCGVNCTTAQVIRPLFICLESLRDCLRRRTDNLIIAHEFASQTNRHITLPHMNTFSTDSERHIHAIVDNQRNSITGSYRMHGCREFHIFTSRPVLFAQLDNGRTALAGSLHHRQKTLFGNGRAVGNEIKCRISGFHSKKIAKRGIIL